MNEEMKGGEIKKEKEEKKKLDLKAEQIDQIKDIGKQEEDDKTQKALKEKIETMEVGEKVDEKSREEKIANYIEKHLPEYLDKEKQSLVFKTFKLLSKLSVKEIIGKENIPQGEKLFIVNHRGGESGRLIASLENPVHIVSAETINWEEGSSLLKWFLKKIGAVPVRETFSHLSEEQKVRVIEKAPKAEKEAHEKAIKNIGLGNLENIRTMVALLLKGEDVAIFTEGPFSRLEEDERKSYAGYALVAREYKRVAGEDLNIVPTGIRDSKVSFGEAFSVDREGSQSKEELEDIATKKIHSLYNSLG